RGISFGPVPPQLAQLNQLLGRQKSRPADGVLRQLIPYRMNPPMFEARASAVWALGFLHEGKPPPDLVTALEGRLNPGMQPAEDVRVRRMAAVSLGRMKATAALPSLRSSFDKEGRASSNPVNNASGWAIEQLTGEGMLPPLPVKEMQRDWFLTPH